MAVERAVENEMILEIPAKSENVGLARLAAATFASHLDFTLEEIEEIKVAVSEAVSNAVIHGYPGGEGRVRLTARRVGQELELVVEDWGVGIEDLERARQPAYSSDPERMGLGFVFMQSFTDHLEVVSRPGEGTRVKMVKRAQSPVRAETEQ